MRLHRGLDSRNVYSVGKTPMIAPMISPRLPVIAALAVGLAGCTSYQVGNDHSNDIGSYAGGTLNSPVTDQNPHVGGDQSYPASTATGREQVPPGKTDY